MPFTVLEPGLFSNTSWCLIGGGDEDACCEEDAWSGVGVDEEVVCLGNLYP